MTAVEVGHAADAPRASEAGRYDAFISYARRDSSFAVDRLGGELRAVGKEVWLDLDITGGAQWRDRVKRGIEACKSLIFVVSPAAIASEACRHELDDAVALNKLIIPVVYQDVPDEQMPRALADSEWVFLRDGDDHATGIRRLLEALEADLEWRDEHTRLAGRAREWLDSDRNSSYLLRGADLREGEAWLAQHEGHGEAPTREQGEYIARSRQAASRRLYALIGSLAAGLVVATVLAIFALIQRQTAISETHVAQSRQLASQSTSTSDLQLASLMALEAYRLSPTLDAQSAILGVADNHEIGAPLVGHQGGVNQVAFSPDGRTMAAATDYRAIQLWDVATHRRILPDLLGHTDRVQNVAFSPDGTMLASASFDKTLRLWSVATHLQIGRPLMGHKDSVETVAFSRDGHTLASGSDDNTVRFWNVDTHKEIGQPLTGHAGAVSSVAFSPHGTILASGSDDNTIRLWDVASHLQIAPPLNAHAGIVDDVAFSPNGRRLAAACTDGTIRMWNLATGHQVGTLSGHAGFVYSVAFSRDGNTLVSGGSDTSIRLWSVATHHQIGAALSGNNAYVDSVTFSHDDTELASGGGDGTVRLWRVASQRQIGTPLTGHTSRVNSVAFSPDGKTLASGNDDQTIRLWDVATHRQLRRIQPGVGFVTSVAFSPDGKTLASAQTGDVPGAQTGNAGGTIRFWNVATGTPISEPLIDVPSRLSQANLGQTTIAYSPKGRQLAFVNIMGVGLLGTSKPFPLIGRLMTGTLTVAFSPDGKELAVGGPQADHTIRLLRVRTQRQIGRPLVGAAGVVHAVAFSPDSKTLASGDAENTIRLWDVTTHRQISVPLTGHTGEVTSLGFSPDGKTLASAGQDGTIRLWDVQTRRELGGPLTGHTGSVQTVAFSPNGRTLASGSVDDTVRLWTTEPIGTYINQLCGYIDVRQAQELWQQANLGIPYQRPC